MAAYGAAVHVYVFVCVSFEKSSITQGRIAVNHGTTTGEDERVLSAGHVSSGSITAGQISESVQ